PASLQVVNIRLQTSQKLVAPTRNQPDGLVPNQPMLSRTQGTCATTNPGEEGFSGACLVVAAKKIDSGTQRTVSITAGDVRFRPKADGLSCYLAGVYEARIAEYEERCRFSTTTEMTSGTARNAPKGPHIQAQKATDKKT